MHSEVANTIFLSWCFVVITGIIRSNSLIQVESVAEPPTVVRTDMYVELPSFPRLSYRLTPPPFPDILIGRRLPSSNSIPFPSLSLFLTVSVFFSPFPSPYPFSFPSSFHPCSWISIPHRGWNGNGATGQYVQPVCLEIRPRCWLCCVYTNLLC